MPHTTTTVWVEKDALKQLRLALTRRNGSTTGITTAVSAAIRDKAKEIAQDG